MGTYPEGGPTSFEELLEPLPEDVRAVASRLRTLVRDTVQDAEEAVSGGTTVGMALYSVDGPNDVVCGIQPTEDVCRLFFHGWEALEGAGYRLDGSGKNARHVKFRSTGEIDPDEVVAMVELAAAAR